MLRIGRRCMNKKSTIYYTHTVMSCQINCSICRLKQHKPKNDNKVHLTTKEEQAVITKYDLLFGFCYLAHDEQNIKYWKTHNNISDIRYWQELPEPPE